MHLHLRHLQTDTHHKQKIRKKMTNLEIFHANVVRLHTVISHSDSQLTISEARSYLCDVTWISSVWLARIFHIPIRHKNCACSDHMVNDDSHDKAIHHRQQPIKDKRDPASITVTYSLMSDGMIFFSSSYILMLPFLNILAICFIFVIAFLFLLKGYRPQKGHTVPVLCSYSLKKRKKKCCNVTRDGEYNNGIHLENFLFFFIILLVGSDTLHGVKDLNMLRRQKSSAHRMLNSKRSSMK